MGKQMGQQDPTKPKNLKYDPVTMTPYQGGNLTAQNYQYTQSPEYQQALKNIGQIVNGPQQENTYMNQGQTAFNNIMDPNYKAYSDADINNQYEKGKKQLSEDWMKQNRELAARQAATGMTGSGTGGTQWNDLNKNQTNALSDFYQNLQNKNTEATRQDKLMAYQQLPQMAGLQNQLQQQQLQNVSAWASLLGGENAAKNQANQWNVGQQNQVNQANWNRNYDIWNAQNQLDQWNAGNKMATEQYNNQNAWQLYLQRLQQQQNQGDQTAGLIGAGLSLLFPGL